MESWLTHRLNPRIDFEIIDEFDYEDKVMYVYSKWFKRMAEAMTLPSFFVYNCNAYLLIYHIFPIFANKKRQAVMSAPDIESSTREERLEYVLSEWSCMHDCKLCGKCYFLKGRSEEELYADYIDGKKSYIDVTLEIRNNNNKSLYS